MHSEVVERRDSFQMLRVAVNIFSKQSRTPTRGGPQDWGLSEEVITPHHKKSTCYKILHRDQTFRDAFVWLRKWKMYLRYGTWNVWRLCRWGLLKAVVKCIKAQVHICLPAIQRCSRTVQQLASCACTPCSVTACPKPISMLASCRVCIILKTATAGVITGTVLN